jgi:putative hemolysin
LVYYKEETGCENLIKTGMETTNFRLASFQSGGLAGVILKIIGPLVDRVLAFKKIERMYKRNNFQGVEKHEFIETALKAAKVHFDYDTGELLRIPMEGPVIVVANHPFGCAEGIILCSLLRKVRPDFKILANKILQNIVEIREFFIFTNPLKTYNYKNLRSLKECAAWLKQGHLLVLFPAGRVAFFQKNLKMITDGTWNNIAAQMATRTKAAVVPLHFSGTNSRLFHIMGRIYYRFRLLMLPREFLKIHRQKIQIRIGRPIPNLELVRFSSCREVTNYLRMRTYLLSREDLIQSQETPLRKSGAAIMPPVDKEIIEFELAALPEEQRLVENGSLTVFYAYHDQIKETVLEIGRLREKVFRELNEGSGLACDVDEFDKTYTHLFIWDRVRREIIGAYRMGETNRLLKDGDKRQLYLYQIFNYSDEFLAAVSPGLEMGRSFLRPEHQKSHYGLFLLWRGIGRFLFRHPEYHTLFGTVSLSKTFDPYSIVLMKKVLVGDHLHVEPKNGYNSCLPAEVERYIEQNKISMKGLSTLVQSIEPDGKDVPILVKQYTKLGAKFQSIALDINFNNTPGVLLTVDVRKAPLKALKLYMGKDFEEYLRYHSSIGQKRAPSFQA